MFKLPKSFCIAAALAASLAGSVWAADDAPTDRLLGTVCYSISSFRTGGGATIDCVGLGKFSSVNEIYSRGYRVVASGTTTGGIHTYVFIELRGL